MLFAKYCKNYSFTPLLLLAFNLLNLQWTCGASLDSDFGPHPEPQTGHQFGFHNAKSFLGKFGWLTPAQASTSGGTPQNIEGIAGPIREYQVFSGLQPTGVLDEATIKMMTSPRCGVRDRSPTENSNNGTWIRRKRFVLNGGRCTKQRLTFRLAALDPRHVYPSYAQINVEIAKAFKIWEQQTDLVFVESSLNDNTPADIEISFVDNDHGDGVLFMSPNASASGDLEAFVLAHAFFPSEAHALGGDIHFNGRLLWRLHNGIGREAGVHVDIGFNVFQVGVHEIGHALGLAHVPAHEHEPIMHPIYAYRPDFRLHDDDIQGIQTLYGAKHPAAGATRTQNSTQPTPPPQEGTTDDCPCETEPNEDFEKLLAQAQFIQQGLLGSCDETSSEIPQIPDEIFSILEIPGDNACLTGDSSSVIA